MSSTPLGRSMHFHSFALAGVLSTAQWHELLDETTQAIGMTPHEPAMVWDYPTSDGAGGCGATIVRPITESFLAVDAWPDHSGAYLIVCSCRQFDVHAVKHVLNKWGLAIGGECGHTLRIPNKRKRRFVDDRPQADPMHGL